MLRDSFFLLLKTIIFFTVLFCLCHSASSQDNNQHIARSGEVYPYPYKNFTFIQPRFDRQDLLYGDYFNSYVIRAAKTFNSSYHLRIELPTANTNTSGENIFGLSDIKVRLLHATPLFKNWYAGYGGEITFPTATDRSLGSGKWQMRPELGIIYFFGRPQETIGTFLFGVDYRFDFAGQSERNHISVLGISPNIDYWTKRWYIGYYATWTYDFISHTWDIPIDIEFGYNVYRKITLAVEYIQPLTQKRTYNNEYSIKLRYSF